ncbi:PAS domain-containing protein [Pyruvatibacter sp.]|uniref:PAS domain-containing protein n=1 Tax=Pyruvatibacter sp. TaxID=1981328 RepID=UPI003263E84E
MSSDTSIADINWDVHEIQAIEHPKNQQLLASYEANRPDGGLPNRGSFDLIDLKDIAPGLLIVEQVPEDEGLIRYRLIGSEIEERTKVAFTGKSPEIFGQAMSEELRSIYRRIFANHRPVMLRGNLLGLGIEHVDYEMVFLPVMSRDDTRVDAICGMFAFN